MQRDEILKALPGRLLPWYEENARDLPWRRTKDPYAVWVSEIMLQQTRVETVIPYWERFMKKLPSVADLASCPDAVLHKYWEGLGYYRRADNMKRAAQVIMEKHGGVFPSSYRDILSLPGIGPYTAGAISSICFGEKQPAVDGNVLRVLSRLAEDSSDISLPAASRMWEKALLDVYPDKDCGAFTQSLMELGATVCLPAGPPDCGVCPMRGLCLAEQNGSFADYPVRPEKKKQKEEALTVFLLVHEEKIAVRKREEGGLLQNLWEFPNIKGTLPVQQAVEEAESLGARILRVEKQMDRTHLFTHVRWKMRCYVIRCANEIPSLTWCTRDELAREYAMATAFRKLLD